MCNHCDSALVCDTKTIGVIQPFSMPPRFGNACAIMCQYICSRKGVAQGSLHGEDTSNFESDKEHKAHIVF